MLPSLFHRLHSFLIPRAFVVVQNRDGHLIHVQNMVWIHVGNFLYISSMKSPDNCSIHLGLCCAVWVPRRWVSPALFINLLTTCSLALIVFIQSSWTNFLPLFVQLEMSLVGLAHAAQKSNATTASSLIQESQLYHDWENANFHGRFFNLLSCPCLTCHVISILQKA